MSKHTRLFAVAVAVAVGTVGLTAPAQAASAAPLTTQTITFHGRAITLVTTKASAASDLARVSAAETRVVPLTTNPCYGLGLLCLFQNANGGGAILGITESALSAPGFINLTDVPLGSGTWNDQMSSWGNDINGTASSATMCWWVDANGGGAGHLMRPLGATIQNVLPSENDQASSVDTLNVTCR